MMHKICYARYDITRTNSIDFQTDRDNIAVSNTVYAQPEIKLL